MKAEIARVNEQIVALSPALLSPEIPSFSVPANGYVKVTARAYNGATYVFAVNATGRERTGMFKLPGSNMATLSVWGEGRSVPVAPSGKVTDTFAPFAVHIYVAAPPIS